MHLAYVCAPAERIQQVVQLQLLELCTQCEARGELGREGHLVGVGVGVKLIWRLYLGVGVGLLGLGVEVKG